MPHDDWNNWKKSVQLDQYQKQRMITKPTKSPEESYINVRVMIWAYFGQFQERKVNNKYMSQTHAIPL